MAADTMTAHPQYLDDDGQGSVCFLLHHLAESKGAARKMIERLGFDWDWNEGYEADVIWMVPIDRPGGDGSEYYDPAPEGTPGAVRYWRFRF